jgi:hypothetical protein
MDKVQKPSVNGTTVFVHTDVLFSCLMVWRWKKTGMLCSHSCGCKTVVSTGTYGRVVGWKSPDVSEEHVASTFGVEAKKETSMKQVASIDVSEKKTNRHLKSRRIFYHEDEGDKFLRNYMALYPRRWNSSVKKYFTLIRLIYIEMI